MYLDASDAIFKNSSVRFLTVQYTHPLQKEQITLNIPEGMMIYGNDLFTPPFVLRCLKYQTKPFHFDLNYTIKIIDGNVNKIELTSNDFITLSENDYLLCSLNKDPLDHDT